MRDYEIPLLQKVYAELCCEFSKHNTYIEIAKDQYQLVFLTENEFREKYAGNKNIKIVGAA